MVDGSEVCKRVRQVAIEHACIHSKGDGTEQVARRMVHRPLGLEGGGGEEGDYRVDVAFDIDARRVEDGVRAKVFESL